MPEIKDIMGATSAPLPAPKAAPPPFRVVSRGFGDLKTKYRPQKIEELVPTCPVEQLKLLINNPNSSRVFLFEGKTGTGKTTCARIIAKANVCLADSSQSKPCLKCAACDHFDKNWDVTEINVADYRKVENARDLVAEMAFKPQFLKLRVYILDEVQQLTPEAQQVLLKHLEEPHPHLLIFLCTTNKTDLNQALIDRASTITFGNISPMDASLLIDQIVEDTLNKPVPIEIKKLLFDRSHGSVRALLNNLQSIFEGGKPSSEDEQEEEGTAEIKAVALAILNRDLGKCASNLSTPAFKYNSEKHRIGIESYLRATLLKMMINPKTTGTPNAIKLLKQLAHLNGTLIHDPYPYNSLVVKCLMAAMDPG